MHAQIQHYGPAVDSLTTTANPHDGNLVALSIAEEGARSTLTLDRATWQGVVDSLAALGIVAQPAEVSA